MSPSWPLVPLGELIREVSRPENVIANRRYRILGAHWYAQGLYIKNTTTGSGVRADRLYRVQQGDFVYNRLFAWKGSFALATNEHEGCYVSNEFPCFNVDNKRLDGRFLWRYFSRPPVWNHALAFSKGGTPTSRNRLKEDKFLAFKIPLPPLDEQRRIVARIEALAAKIEEAGRLRSQATEDANRFVASLHLRLAGTRSRQLGQFLEPHEDREEIQVGRSYPQVGVKGFGQGLFERPPVSGGQTTYGAFNRLYTGAVVLSQVKGWEGAIAVCPPKFDGWYASPEYRTFRCIPEGAIAGYLAPLFASPWFWTQLGGLTRGVGARRERVRPELFLQMEMAMPCADDQRLAVQLFERVQSIQSLQAETAAELNALLLSIIEKAFRGQLL